MSLLPVLSGRRGLLDRWDPIREMRELQREFGRFLAPSGNGDGLAEELWAPLMDVVENGKSITVKFEVPGIDKKDIHIEMDNGLLTVSGERKIEKEEKKEDYTRVERSYGSFSRSFTLPDYVDAKKISAETNDGVLKIVMPKIEGAKPAPQKIEVK